jgi:phosphatidylinositol glycan class W
VLWTAAFNSSFLLGYLLIESHFLLSPTSTSPCPALLEAINANGLAVFLIANLLTGLVNLSIQTMYASKGISVLVLLLYSGGVCSLAWALRKRRLKL